MRCLMLFAAALLLSACQTSYEGNEDSPYYQIPVGSKLILRQEVTIPPHVAGVYLQDGEIKPFSLVNKYYPHCRFEVWKLRDAPQAIKPDEFTITKVTQEMTDSVSAGNVRLADVSIGIGMQVGHRDDGASMEIYVTRLNLRSPTQPDVFRLSCGQWAYPPTAQHVTISEIRKALGDVFTLSLASNPR